MAHLLLRDLASQAYAVLDLVRPAQALAHDDLAIQAKAVLGRSRIFDLRSLDVEQEADCVVLRGSVDSFYHKQLAQELVKMHMGGVEVINEIDVDYSRDRSVDDCDWLW